MRKFAVICEELDVAEQGRLAAYFGEQHFGFWHRLANCWLLVCPDGESTESIMEPLINLFGSKPTFFVLEIQDWTAFIPQAWNEWFSKHWNMPPEPYRDK